MKKVLITIAFMMVVVLPVSVRAAFLEAADDVNGGIENISKDQNVENAYLAGETINVDGDVKKDLIAAGSVINVNGKVEDDLIAAGSSLNIKNSIGGSARVVGSTITISENINEDLFAAGAEILISEKAKVAGDFIFMSGKTDIKGEVGGSIKAIGGDVVISGKVKGDILLRNINKLVVEDTAEVSGKIVYYSPNEALIESGAKIVGGVQYNKIDQQLDSWGSYAKKMTWGITLYQIIGSLLLLLIFIYFAPKISKKIVEEFYANSLLNMGWGIVTFIVLPIVSLILLALSFKLTIVLMLFYSLYMVLGSTFTSLAAGSWAWKSITKAQEYEVNWQSVLLGVVLTTLLSFVPIIGSFALFVLLIISFGVLIRLTFVSLRK